MSKVFESLPPEKLAEGMKSMCMSQIAVLKQVSKELRESGRICGFWENNCLFWEGFVDSGKTIVYSGKRVDSGKDLWFLRKKWIPGKQLWILGKKCRCLWKGFY